MWKWVSQDMSHYGKDAQGRVWNMKAKIDVREGEEAADAVASELAGKLAGRGGGHPASVP